MTDLQRFYRTQPLAKPASRQTVKRRKKRVEKRVKDAVREACVERDGYCRAIQVQGSRLVADVVSPFLWASCEGDSEWAHMHAKRRSKTRGMAAEDRHDTAHSLMLCHAHHDQYDGRSGPRLLITALTRKGADGPLKFTRSRTSREGSIPKGRGVPLSQKEQS